MCKQVAFLDVAEGHPASFATGDPAVDIEQAALLTASAALLTASTAWQYPLNQLQAPLGSVSSTGLSPA